MKLTLLDITQDILSSMDSDEVNSISDTEEAYQIARIVRENYFNLVANSELPEHKTFFQLNATGIDTPTIMKKPDDVIDIEYIKYDQRLDHETETRFNYVYRMSQFDFMNMMEMFPTDEDGYEDFTLQLGGDNIHLKCRTDKHPQFYTAYTDNYIIFDSYDAGMEANLQKSNTMCYGYKEQPFDMVDDFVPNLDHRQFSLLLSESKAQAFIELKQAQNVNAERKARENRIMTQKNKRNVPGEIDEYDRLPNYGRSRRYGHYERLVTKGDR